ncbi:unnamed protein product [Brachionus calyciflorus]|uniref:Uncharacterized protein n=1 Tax=Brachionus calyciflorus TaxID=104777 RepID=A0A814DLD4_9BILA|nr:unnamed protein product [Brachionus calyciflorus]
MLDINILQNAPECLFPVLEGRFLGDEKLDKILDELTPNTSYSPFSHLFYLIVGRLPLYLEVQMPPSTDTNTNTEA